MVLGGAQGGMGVGSSEPGRSGASRKKFNLSKAGS